MTISVDWGQRLITVERLDIALVGADPLTGREVRQLDVDAFRQALNALQASEDGSVFPTTHEHTPPQTLAGVTYARRVQVINGYVVTFEDGTYAVNLVGADSNLADVTTVNGVQVRSTNSAGSTQVGVTLPDLQAGLAAVPEAVRDVALLGPTLPPNSLGEAVSVVLGINSKGCVMIDNHVYDPSTRFLRSARIRVFPTPELTAAATPGATAPEGEVWASVITGTPDGRFPQQPQTIRGVRV